MVHREKVIIFVQSPFSFILQNVLTMNQDHTTPPHSPLIPHSQHYPHSTHPPYSTRVKIEIDPGKEAAQEDKPHDMGIPVPAVSSSRNHRLLNQSIADLQLAASRGSKAEFTKAVREVGIFLLWL